MMRCVSFEAGVSLIAVDGLGIDNVVGRPESGVSRFR
jgi:hypothetical protein